MEKTQIIQNLTLPIISETISPGCFVWSACAVVVDAIAAKIDIVPDGAF